MQQYSASRGLPNEWHMVHLGSRAVGGAGLIITECTAIAPEGMNTLSDTAIWNEAQVEAWRPIVRFVQQQGSRIAVQLWHAGGKGSSRHPREGMTPLGIEEGGWIPKSASATPIGRHRPVQMTIAEIGEVKRQFVRAALHAVAAGFDAVELHAAHGYLLHQFYSELVNRRTDDYGGSFENRVRLLRETVREVRAVIPQGMPLLVRISAVDYDDSPHGWTLDDSVRMAHILRSEGVDLITASGGGFVQVDPHIVQPGYQAPLAARIRREVSVATGAVGMIADARQAGEIIEKGDADLAVIAREHLRNPYFAIDAAIRLGVTPDIPWQYRRAY